MTAKDAPANSSRTDPSRAARLHAATHSTHEALDISIMAARPFDSIQAYARFLRLQHAFHREAAPLYAGPALAGPFADLAGSGRLDAVLRDAAALGIELPLHAEAPPAAAGLALLESLGWLYVVEGSNLGAAFLLKAAGRLGLTQDRGAAHLAEPPEGRANRWRAFKRALDAVELSRSGELRAVAGANAAFARMRVLVPRFLIPGFPG